MAVTRSDPNFHDRIAGKYRLGKRVRGRWPYLFFLRPGKGGRYGKMFRTILFHLDLYLPGEKGAAVTDRDRGGSRHAPLLTRNIFPAGTSVPQGTKPASATCTFIYHHALKRLIPARSAAGDRMPFPNMTGQRPSGTSRYRNPPGKAATGLEKGRIGPIPVHIAAIRPLTIKRSAWQILPQKGASHRGDSGSQGEKAALRRGDQTPSPAGVVHRHHPVWLPTLASKGTGHVPRLMQQLLQRDMRIAPLADKAWVRHARHGSGAASLVLPENSPRMPLLATPPSSTPGMLRKQVKPSPAGAELVFNRQRQTEFELEELKKVVVQAREKAAERAPSSALPLEAEIKKQIDVERITDQVYRNIERRIRREREMRGV